MKKILSLLIIIIFITLNVFLFIIAKKINMTLCALSVAITFCIFWLSCKYLFKGLYDVTCNNNFIECEVDLSNYQLNGIGTTMLGSFGQYGYFRRRYQCFCFLFFIPLFPLDCVICGPIKEVDKDGIFDLTASFGVLGTSQWYPLEVAVLMWRPCAIISLVAALIYLFQ